MASNGLSMKQMQEQFDGLNKLVAQLIAAQMPAKQATAPEPQPEPAPVRKPASSKQSSNARAERNRETLGYYKIGLNQHDYMNISLGHGRFISVTRAQWDELSKLVEHAFAHGTNYETGALTNR